MNPTRYGLRLKVCFLLIVIPFSVTVGQTKISGVVKDCLTDEPVPYASIELASLSKGSICDSDGTYILSFSDEVSVTDSVRISSIGYRDTAFSLIDAVSKGFREVCLEQHTVELNEISVTATQLGTPKRIVYGNDSESLNIVSGWSVAPRSGSERGVLIKPRRKHKGYLERLNFHLAKSTYDSLRFQLRIYRPDENENFAHDLEEEIYIATDKRTGWVSTELGRYRLPLDGETVIALRIVEAWGNPKDKILYFSGGLLNKGTYYRHNAGSPLGRSSVVGISINVEATVYE